MGPMATELNLCAVLLLLLGHAAAESPSSETLRMSTHVLNSWVGNARRTNDSNTTTTSSINCTETPNASSVECNSTRAVKKGASEYGITVTQIVIFSGLIEAQWTGSLKAVYQVGYGIAIEIYDEASLAYKTGCTVTSTVITSRRAATVTFTAIVSPTESLNVAANVQALNGAMLSLGISSANAALSMSVTVPTGAQMVIGKPTFFIGAKPPPSPPETHWIDNVWAQILVAFLGFVACTCCCCGVFVYWACHPEIDEPPPPPEHKPVTLAELIKSAQKQGGDDTDDDDEVKMVLPKGPRQAVQGQFQGGQGGHPEKYHGSSNQGYNNQGYNAQGYNKEGYTEEEQRAWDSQGYGNQGYGNQGYGNQGYGNQGYPVEERQVGPGQHQHLVYGHAPPPEQGSSNWRGSSNQNAPQTWEPAAGMQLGTKTVSHTSEYGNLQH